LDFVVASLRPQETRLAADVVGIAGGHVGIGDAGAGLEGLDA